MNDVPRSVRIGRYITDHVDPVANVLGIIFAALLVLGTLAPFAVLLWQALH